MTKDYVYIGSAPADEDCVSVGDGMNAMRAESQRFIELCRQVHGPEPIGARLAVKVFDHDLGPYCEAVCYYDNDAAMEYALKVEGNLPKTWNDAPAVPSVTRKGTGPNGEFTSKDMGLDATRLMEMAEAATFSDDIEGFCKKCGNWLSICEPDADTQWCESCDDSTPVYNPLIELGII